MAAAITPDRALPRYESPCDVRSVARIGVLFLFSPLEPAADTRVQMLLAKSLDPSRFRVHAAADPGGPGLRSRTYEELATIPGIGLQAFAFAPQLSSRRKLEQTLRLAVGGPAMLARLLALAAFVRRRGIGIVDASSRPRDVGTGVLLAKLAAARSVIHLHTKCGPWMGPALRWALRRADALVGVSAFAARSAIEDGCDPRKVHAVLNAIEPAAWDFTLDGATARADLGLPGSAPVLVSVSRLFHWKGHSDLLRALALVRRELPDTRLLIAGVDDPGGGTEKPGLASELRALIASLDLGDHVSLLGYRPDVPRLMAAADVYAMPSFEEPFGLVFAEAMAMKRPVVALDNGGTPEVVAHGHTGLLSRPGDVGALAANLLALLRDPGLRARMGETGRARVEHHFHPARMADDTAAVYEKLVKA